MSAPTTEAVRRGGSDDQSESSESKSLREQGRIVDYAHTLIAPRARALSVQRPTQQSDTTNH